MARGFSIFVGIGAKLLPSLNGVPGEIERRFGQMNRRLRLQAAETKLAFREMSAALKPIAAMAAAGGLTLGFKDTITGGANFMHEVAALRLSGRSATETALAIRQAHKTMAEVPTSTLVDNLKILRETAGAFGDINLAKGHAMENLSFNQRLGYMMTNVMGMDRESASHALVAAIQALEIRGSAMDPKRYQREMNSLFQASSFFSGKEGAFTPASMRDFAKTGNIPLKMFSERFMTRILPALITEVGSGDIVGTQATAFNNWVMGRVGTGNKNAVAFAEKIGLVPKKGMGGNLSKTGWTPNTMAGTSLALSDPLAWAEQILLPKLAKAGININDTKALSIALSQLMTKETARRYAMALTDPAQRGRLHRDEANINRAMSSEEGYKFMLANDPQAAWAKIMSKLDNLATTLGEKVFTDKTISALNKFADGIDKLTGFFDKHPTASRGVVGGMGIGALGATAALFGGGKFIGQITGFLFSALRGGIAAAWRFAGPLMFRGVLVLGTFIRSGFIRLAPLVMEAATMAFALLSNPIGWGILAAAAAVAAGVLIWHFRKQIGDWFSRTWPQIKSTFLSVDWGSIGRSIALGIADGLTFGLASKVPGVATALGGLFRGSTAAAPAPKPAGTFRFDRQARVPPLLAGKRAAGGPVLGGRMYLVGERGPELFQAPMSGSITNATRTAAMFREAARSRRVEPMAQRDRRGRGTAVRAGGDTYNFTINGVTDPEQVGRVVEMKLRKMAAGQDALLSD